MRAQHQDALDIAGTAGAADEGKKARPFVVEFFPDALQGGGQIGNHLASPRQHDVMRRQNGQRAAAGAGRRHQHAPGLRHQRLAFRQRGVAAFQVVHDVGAVGPHFRQSQFPRDRAKAERDSLVAEYPALRQTIDSARVKAIALERKQAKQQTTDPELASEIIYARTDLQNAQNELADCHRKAALLKDAIVSLQNKMDAIENSASNIIAMNLEAAKTRLRNVRTNSKMYPNAETYFSDFSPVTAQKAQTGLDGKFSFSYPRNKAFTIFAKATRPSLAEKYYWLVNAPTNGGMNSVLLNNNNLVYADPDGYFKIKPKKQHTGQ
jgi:hypothetical protein